MPYNHATGEEAEMRAWKLLAVAWSMQVLQDSLESDSNKH